MGSAFKPSGTSRMMLVRAEPPLPVDGNHVNAAGPLAHESDIVLADHSAGGQAVAGVDDEADELALLDEAPGHVLFDRCHEHARARTGDDEFTSALAGTLEVGHHAVDLLLQNRRLGLVGRAHSRVLATQPSQLSLQHLDASVEEGIIGLDKRLPGLDLGTICDEKPSDEAVRPGADLGALGGPRDAFCHRAQWERHDEEEQARQADGQCGDHDGAGPVSLQTRARRQKRKALAQWERSTGWHQPISQAARR